MCAAYNMAVSWVTESHTKIQFTLTATSTIAQRSISLLIGRFRSSDNRAPHKKVVGVKKGEVLRDATHP